MVDTNYYHNKGEKDASAGRYNPPIGILTPLFASDISEDIKHQEAYDAGYRNAKNQKNR